jgi:HEAT repeats
VPSYAFERFYESFFGDPYMAWHDGLDTEALLSLEGEERHEAERLLMQALGSGDYRPAAGLAALQSQESAPHLKEQLNTATGRALIEAARGLWRMEKYPPAAQAIIGVLQSNPWWGDRMDAAMALSEVDTPESEAALWDALNDPEDLVRHHAATSLIEMRRPDIDTNDFGSYPVAIAIMSEDKDKRAAAVNELRKLVVKK